MTSASAPDTAGLDAYFALPRRHQLFVDEYVRIGVGAQAMRNIGFKGRRPEIAASKLLAQANVWSAVEARTAQAIAESGMNSRRVLEEIGRIALFDIRKLCNADGDPIPIDELPPEAAAAVSSFKISEERTERAGNDVVTQYRVKEYRLNSKNEALKMAASYLKLWTERSEISGPNGKPIPVATTSVTPEQLAEAVRSVRDSY